MPSPKQLFHAIVIVGAALTAGGCGDDEGRPTVDGGAVVADARVVDSAVPRDTGADVREDAIVIIL